MYASNHKTWKQKRKQKNSASRLARGNIYSYLATIMDRIFEITIFFM